MSNWLEGLYQRSDKLWIPKAIGERAGLKPTDMVLWSLLTKYQRGKDTEWPAWPSHGGLADELGMGEDAIKASLVRLEQHGLIVSQHRHGHSKLYRLVEPRWLKEAAGGKWGYAETPTVDDQGENPVAPSGISATHQGENPEGGTGNSTHTIGNFPGHQGDFPEQKDLKEGSQKDLNEGSHLKAPPPVARASKANRKKSVQPELPTIPPKPPRETSYEEDFYAQFQKSRRMKLESMGVDVMPDKPLHPAGQVVAIRSLLSRCNGNAEAKQGELIALMKAFLQDDFAGSQDPPYPFQLLAYSKNFTPRLLAEVRGDALAEAH